MIFSTHHDAPVAFPDSMRVLDATVTRRARGSGKIISPDQRADVITALNAMTIWPAWQHFEEASKGSIEVGKLADLVILSDDPTTVDPDTLDQIRVTETIKDGETIYMRDAKQAALNSGTASEAALTGMLFAMHDDGPSHGQDGRADSCPSEAIFQLGAALSGASSP